MNLLDKKLSSLLTGSHVRFTDINGQVTEGVIDENDGIESLSVRVTSVTTLKYSQIVMLDEYGQSDTPINDNVKITDTEENSAEKLETKEEKERETEREVKEDTSVSGVFQVSCDKETVSAVYKSLDTAEKNAFAQVYNKFQSFLKSHEKSKYEEVIKLIWHIIEDNNWDFNKKVNLFLAYIQLSNDDFTDSAESFFYAGESRYAYCVACQGIGNDNYLYQLAGAFSAIYLLSESPAELPEASDVLRKSAVVLKDISGLEYVLKNSKSAEAKETVTEIMRKLCRKYISESALLSDNARLTAELRKYYPVDETGKKITDYLSRISGKYAGESKENTESTAEPDISKVYDGHIIRYNFFEEKGTVKSADNKEYPFELRSITDESLQKQVRKISSKQFIPIKIKFSLAKYGNRYVVDKMKRGIEIKPPVAKSPESNGSSMGDANYLFTSKNYTEAIKIYKMHMNGKDWETAFTQIIMCYLALCNENDDSYIQELRAFVEKYVDKTTKNAKTLEVLQQFYNRIHDYNGTIRALNDLMELCGPSEYGRMLHYITGKERCYRFMKDYRSAISELLDWLEIVKRNKMKERYQQRDTLIYPELAELYFESGDIENARKYINLSAETERIQVLQQKLDAKKTIPLQEEESETDEESFGDEEDIIDEVLSEPEESLQTLYEEYKDTAGFDALDIDDKDIINYALGLGKEKLYCLLTYLHCSAILSADSVKTRPDDNGDTVYIGQVIKSVDTAFAYAFNSPLVDSEHLSTEIIAVFEEAQRYIPDISKAMFSASAMYSLFSTPSIPDYSTSDLPVVIEDYDLKQYPALLPLINDLVTFRETTGYGMDAFAMYKTDSTVLQSAVNSASECRQSVEERNKLPEQYIQLRQTRELLFGDPDGDIKKCLDISAENRISECGKVVKIMQELFIKNGRPVSPENIDRNKIKSYIDRKYEEATDIIRMKGFQPAKQFRILVGKRANNLFTVTLRAVTCICEWAFSAEHLAVEENAFVKAQYEKTAPKVINELNDIIKSCEEFTAENGFDWGTESIHIASEELLAKMNGSYNIRIRHYFFIDFLRGDDILLNDNYLPEIQSTFCDVSGFNILSRIERHTEMQLPALHERFTEILSNNEAKHNFRTARLIKAYGEDMGIREITEHKDIEQYKECLRQARQRFETKCQDFSAELELSANYGRISNMNGEKDLIFSIAYNWYRICKVTGDYGFYVRLLETLRNNISVNANRKGEQLRRLLEEISGNPKYNFGVFTKEMILEKIEDQNFSAAEFIMGCIIRGDVNAISDYSAVPSGYFKEFQEEYATNYRAVRGSGRDIIDTIYEHSGKKDLGKALAVLTNNAYKEKRGGANLLKSWMPNGGPSSIEQITTLLTRLGFRPVTVKQDESIDSEAYQVVCRKQTGKVNYVHHIPAFGSKSETEGFRVLCLYGNCNCDLLMDKFRSANATSKNTIVLLDFAMNSEERKKLAHVIKSEKSFAKTFIVIDRVVMFYLAKHYAENTVIKRLLSVTLPFAYYQPFVEASSQDMPPELFTGRETELTSIESPEGANLVYGGRQLGKSALLKMAKRNVDRNGNGDRAVWIEIKDINAQDALKVVRDKLVINDILDESCRCDTWSELAGQIERRLKDENPGTRINYLLLMLDEADKFIETSGLTDDQPVTALKNLPSDRFKLVMAGLHNLSRYNRKSMHANSNLIHLKPITIKQFRREEATKLLTSILAYLGFNFTQNIIDNILASTYNYPGLIQFYCQKLLEAMKNEDYAGYDESATPPYMVTESHYKKVLSDTAFTELVNQKFEATLFTEEEGHSNYHIIALILAYLYYAEPNEKGYTDADLLRIAEEYRINRVLALKPEQLAEILNEMCDLNVITVMDGNYRFATDGFRKLLGNLETIEKSISEYFEEDITL